MLKIINRFSDIDIEQLMAVYRQSNQEKGALFYPNLSEQQQLFRAEDDFISYLREDFFRQHHAVYAIWVYNALYCSALRVETFKDGVLLAGLETNPNLRRRGFAYSLTTETLLYLHNLGYNAVYSHVDKRNKPSLRVHKKCGFQRISESATFLDGSVTQTYCTLCKHIKSKPPA